MKPKKDRMTGPEKAMSLREEFAMPDLPRNACKISFVMLFSAAGWGLLILCLSAVPLGLSGCGASSVKPQVGSITVTDINGVAAAKQPSTMSPLTLTVGSGTYLDVTLKNDTALLGADWTVSCGSALPPGTPLPPGQTVDTSCGYFTPIHTASCTPSGTPSCIPSYLTSAAGYVTYYTAPAAPPKAGTVTLYASSSTDHSQFSALTLVVQGQPISVGIVASTPPPFTLPVSGTMSLTGTLSNDYTVGGGSITWSLSCQSSDCGSLNATKTTSGTAITYTAPAAVPTGNTVTVTATSVTDPTESNSIIITIT
jgi:hypothetical protein